MALLIEPLASTAVFAALSEILVEVVDPSVSCTPCRLTGTMIYWKSLAETARS